MNICVAGKNNIAVDVLDKLIKINNGRYKLSIICNEKRKELLGFQKSLRDFATENQIPEITLEDAYELENLVFLSMEYDLIVLPSKFKSARLYNIHFSYLPEYKGMYTSCLPILKGAKYTGVTFHRIDEGIDTGDFIERKKIDIDVNDTCRDLYIKYLSNGAEIVIKHLEEVIEGTEKVFRQEAENASYYPIGTVNYKDLQLNMNDVAVSIERQIRAYSFREYQMPKFNGDNIIACEITDEKSHEKAGKIIEENDKFYKVTTIDYLVRLYKDRFDEMFTACQNGDLALVKDICSCKKHIYIIDNHGWTPLIVATYNNQIDIVNYLIENGANINDKNYHGTNLIMYAKEAYRKTGDRTLFDFYKNAGLDINEKDEYGLSVVDYINKEGVTELL